MIQPPLTLIFVQQAGSNYFFLRDLYFGPLKDCKYWINVVPELNGQPHFKFEVLNGTWRKGFIQHFFSFIQKPKYLFIVSHYWRLTWNLVGWVIQPTCQPLGLNSYIPACNSFTAQITRKGKVLVNILCGFVLPLIQLWFPWEQRAEFGVVGL